MSLRLNDFLFELKSNAKKYEQIDINGNFDTLFLQKHSRKIICFIISVVVVFFLNNGFSSTFVDYAGTILSIFIGLFITALIFSFDKFYSAEKKNISYTVYSIKDKKEEYVVEQNNEKRFSSTEKLLDTQAYNYTKQFTYITGYNIVLCVYVLLLLSISCLFEECMSLDISKIYLILGYKLIGWENLILFVLVIFVVLQRFLVIYWILSVMYNTVFVVSSMVNFMIIKIDR